MKFQVLVSMIVFIWGFAQNGNSQTSDKQTIGYLSDRVMAVYNDHSENWEEKYTSTEYYNIWKAVTEYDKKLVGEVGFFDSDHWWRSQDSCDPKMSVISAEINSSTSATVKVRLTDCGESSVLTFPMVYERDDWFIDDFVTWFEGKEWSEKKMMKDYCAENGIQVGTETPILVQETSPFLPIKKFVDYQGTSNVLIKEVLKDEGYAPIGDNWFKGSQFKSIEDEYGNRDFRPINKEKASMVQVYQGSNLYEMSMRLYTKEELIACIQQLEDMGYRMLLNNDNSPWFDAARCRYLKFQHRQRPTIAINEYDYYEVTLDE